LNAIILQVRPACDALYRSDLEPWSEYLSGKMGQPPSPEYDPLHFAIEEAHARGLELHAWFNPYRARHSSAKSPASPLHLTIRRPDLAKVYGEQRWLDPGEKDVQNHSLRVILDVVKRYDIDGVHIDDYFYPYKVKGPTGQDLPFPDEPCWKRYIDEGGTLSRDDWRRENVNRFVERLYGSIKREKRWVKFGISPFGIGRPGKPAQIKGFDQFTELYADTEKWLRNGWCDYWTPQLYWRIDPPAQSYPVLLKWWAGQNAMGRRLWPGNYTSRAGEWPAQEIVNQVERTRAQPGATGNVHFSMKALMQDRGGVATQLLRQVYAEPALVPPCPWLDDRPPRQPSLRLDQNTGTIQWSSAGPERVARWAVQTLRDGKWTVALLPADSRDLRPENPIELPEAVCVAAVDRCGNASAPALLKPRR
jgi:uncharacterized lipoprotein YddW (UPF0748 family)